MKGTIEKSQCHLLHIAQYVNTTLDFCYFPKKYCLLSTVVYVWLLHVYVFYPISKIIPDSLVIFLSFLKGLFTDVE